MQIFLYHGRESSHRKTATATADGFILCPPRVKRDPVHAETLRLGLAPGTRRFSAAFQTRGELRCVSKAFACQSPPLAFAPVFPVRRKARRRSIRSMRSPRTCLSTSLTVRRFLSIGRRRPSPQRLPKRRSTTGS